MAYVALPVRAFSGCVKGRRHIGMRDLVVIRAFRPNLLRLGGKGCLAERRRQGCQHIIPAAVNLLCDYTGKFAVGERRLFRFNMLLVAGALPGGCHAAVVL